MQGRAKKRREGVFSYCCALPQLVPTVLASPCGALPTPLPAKQLKFVL